MNKRIVFAFIAFFILCLALPGVAAHSIGVTVSINDDGFNPGSVEVKTGESVTWVNAGTKEHWLASNFHPTHTEYPGSGIDKCSTEEESRILDACRGLKQGETYTFTFDKVGQWGIHDHFYPAHQMSVKVISGKKGFFQHIFGFLRMGKSPKKIAAVSKTSSAAPAEASASVEDVAMAAFDNCKGFAGAKFGCYANEMKNVSFLYGDKYAFKVLAQVQKIDPVAKGCHFIAHGVGWGAWQRDPSNWQKLIAGSSAACSYGEQMGIIELYTQSLPDGKLTKEYVPSLCGPSPKSDCNHAVGHMMLLEADNNLTKAIELCSGLNDSAQNFWCLTGMFMERHIASNLVEHGVVPKSWANWPARLPLDEKLCRTFTGQYSVACWREIAHPAFYYFNQSPKRMFDFCNTAPSYEAARLCKDHSLPELFNTYNHNISAEKGACALESQADPAFEKECYLTLIGMKTVLIGPNPREDTEYCNSLMPDLIAPCLERAKGALKATYVNDQIDEQ